MLSTGESPAPAVLVATALLVHKLQANEDLLKSDWTRCKELTADGHRVVLNWCDGRLYVYCRWDAYRYDNVWLASARQTS